MNKVENIITKTLSWICIFIMGLMSLLVIISVFLRYVFSISFVWSEELITFLFLATTYFGVSLGVRYDEHIKIDFFIEKLNGKMKYLLETIISIIVIFVQIIIFKYSLNWISQVGNVLSPGLRIPIWIIYSMMPISCILVSFYEIWKIVQYIREAIQKSSKGVINE